MTQLESVKPKTMDFSKKVRAFRLANDLSQEDLAGLLGVTSNYVYMLEKGTKVPKETLRMLFESLVSSPIYKPISEGDAPESASSNIRSKLAPAERIAEEVHQVKETVNSILSNADRHEISLFAAMAKAFMEGVSKPKSPSPRRPTIFRASVDRDSIVEDENHR